MGKARLLVTALLAGGYVVIAILAVWSRIGGSGDVAFLWMIGFAPPAATVAGLIAWRKGEAWVNRVRFPWLGVLALAGAAAVAGAATVTVVYGALMLTTSPSVFWVFTIGFPSLMVAFPAIVIATVAWALTARALASRTRRAQPN